MVFQWYLERKLHGWRLELRADLRLIECVLCYRNHPPRIWDRRSFSSPQGLVTPVRVVVVEITQ